MGRVSIVRTGGNTDRALEKAIELVGGLGRFICRSDRVMLKPNLNGVEGCTDIGLTESVIRLLLDSGVREVFIGEATFGSAGMTRMFFEKTGYKDLAARYGIRLVNLNESEAVEVRVPSPLIVEKVRVAREVLDVDRIVNLPNMKVHYATGVTLCLKNLKGVLVGDEKRRFHEVGLDRAIADLHSVVRADLDCISCMERMGPRGGDIVRLNLLMAGANAAEVDWVGCRVMGYDLREVRHLATCVEANRTDLGAIEVLGERVEDVRRPFRKVNLEGIIPSALAVHNRDACSSCMNAFLLSCQLLQGEIARHVDVYMGSLAARRDASRDLSVAFGNCCVRKFCADRSVRGCPPYPFALGECLSDVLGKGKSG